MILNNNPFSEKINFDRMGNLSLIFSHKGSRKM